MRKYLKIGVITLASMILAGTGYSKGNHKENLSDQLMMGTLWQQTSAEYRAIAYQTFNMAKMVLDLELNKKGKKKKAIVLDIDETVLDNSPYQAMVIARKTGYPDKWFEWIDAAKAEPVPGALEFLKYADSKGVKIFYLSNRKIKKNRKVPGMKNTIKNLNAFGFPQVKESHLYLRSKESSKIKRRSQISENYDIVMLFGDNLNDFDGMFEHKGIKDRKAAVDEVKSMFGHRFFVLPNPMYGEWEGAVYDYNWRASEKEKKDMRLKALNDWKF